jgi:hypothetical protein
MSSVTASLNRTRVKPRTERTFSAGESSPTSRTLRPDGPSAAPRRRKTATSGTALRSSRPDSSEATMMTMPMTAIVATNEWIDEGARELEPRARTEV